MKKSKTGKVAAIILPIVTGTCMVSCQNSGKTETIEEGVLDGYLCEPFTESAVNGWLDKIGSDNQYKNKILNYVSQMEFKRDGHNDFHLECGKVMLAMFDAEFQLDFEGC